jgi:hypothetical protein
MQKLVSAKQIVSSLWAANGLASGQVQKSAAIKTAANLNRGTERLQCGIITRAGTTSDRAGRGDIELT